MKPKSIEWVPIIGYRKYLKRYFLDAENRTPKDAEFAIKFDIYHTYVAVPFVVFIFKILQTIF